MNIVIGKSRLVQTTLVIITILPIVARGDELRAGVAKVNLPIGKGVRLAGSPAGRFASGTHEPLQARFLLLKTLTQSVAIVACDLHSFQSRRVSEEARRNLGISYVLFAASGSHSAPGRDNDASPSWLSSVEDAMLVGLRQAASTTFAARLGVGIGTVELAYNIRQLDEAGRIKMLWRNPERKPTGPLWTTVPAWRIEDDRSEIRALIYSAACRASVLRQDNQQLSGDYPGSASRHIETKLGARTVAIFLQGATGNLAPFANESSFEEMEKVGEELAREVVRVGQAIVPKVDQEPSLAVYGTDFTFHGRWGKREQIPVESATVVINRNYALAAFPGVPFVEHQIALADRSPLSHTLLAAHTQTENGVWAGVLPTIRAASEGGYGASYGTRLEVGAGEAMVDAALVNIHRALGKLDDLPRGTLVLETPPEGRVGR